LLYVEEFDYFILLCSIPAWRRVFEEGRRGQVDDVTYTGSQLITVLGGTRLQAWQAGPGGLMWETDMQGSSSHM